MTTELKAIRQLLDQGQYDAAREQAEQGAYRFPEQRSEFRLLQAEADSHLSLDDEALRLAAAEFAARAGRELLRERWRGLLRGWEERLLTDGDWKRAERWVSRYDADGDPKPWSEREELCPLVAAAVRLRRGWPADEWLAREPEESPWRAWLEALRAVYSVPHHYAEAVTWLLTALEKGLPPAVATRTLPRWTLCAVAQGDGGSLPLDTIRACVRDTPFWGAVLSLVCALQEGAPDAAEEAIHTLANCEFPLHADPDARPWVVWACRLTGLAATEAEEPDADRRAEPLTRLLTVVEGKVQGRATAKELSVQTRWRDGPPATMLSRLLLAFQGEARELRWQAERLGPEGERLNQFAALVEAWLADPPKLSALDQAMAPLRNSPDAAEAFLLGAAMVVRGERGDDTADLAQALRWLDVAVQAFPLQAELYAWRARAQALRGDLAAALRDYRLCGVLRPPSPPYREMAELMVQARDWALWPQIPGEVWQEEVDLTRRAGLAMADDPKAPEELVAQALTWLRPHADAGGRTDQWAVARLAWRLSKPRDAAAYLQILAEADPPEIQAGAAWTVALERLGRPRQQQAARLRRELVAHLSGQPADAEKAARGLLEFGSGPESAELWRGIWSASGGQLPLEAVRAAATACCAREKLDAGEWAMLVALAKHDPAGAFDLAEPHATRELAAEPETQRTRWQLWRRLAETLPDHPEAVVQEETERHGLRTLALAGDREDLLKELADAGDTAARQELERRKRAREAHCSLARAREALHKSQWERCRSLALKALEQGAPLAEVAPLLAAAYYRLGEPEKLLSKCPEAVGALPEDDFFGRFYRALRGDAESDWPALVQEDPKDPWVAFFAARAETDPAKRVKRWSDYLGREDAVRREEAQVSLLVARLEAGQVKSVLRELRDLPPERESQVRQALEAHRETVEPVLGSLGVTHARQLAQGRLDWFPVSCREQVLRRAAQPHGDWKEQSEFLVRLLCCVADGEAAQRLVCLLTEDDLLLSDKSLKPVRGLQALVANQSPSERKRLREAVANVEHPDAGYVAQVLTGDPKPVVVDGSNVTGDERIGETGGEVCLERLEAMWEKVKEAGLWPVYTVVDPGEPFALETYNPQDVPKYNRYVKDLRLIRYVPGDKKGKGQQIADYHMLWTIEKEGWQKCAYLITHNDMRSDTYQGKRFVDHFPWLYDQWARMHVDFDVLPGGEIVLKIPQKRSVR